MEPTTTDAELEEFDLSLMEDEDYEEEEPSGMTQAELQEYLQAALEDAESYIDEEVSPVRARLARAYRGEKDGDEVEGRSQVVSRVVYETNHQLLPPLMRIFFGGERAVEFQPVGDEDIAIADQATAYIDDVVLRQHNQGVVEGFAALKDALLKKVGIFKVALEEESEVTSSSRVSGVAPEVWGMLVLDPSTEVLWATTNPDTGLISGEVRQSTPRRRISVKAVPPEEVLIDRHAARVQDARVLSHRCEVTASDLVEMGYRWDEIEPHLSAGGDSALQTNEERQERRPYDVHAPERVEPASRTVRYDETYIKIDYDGDRRAELRRITSLHGGKVVLRNDLWDEDPFVFLMPDPEPHTVMEGSCPAESVEDIQDITTSVNRGMLDSLSFSLTPRAAILDGQVNVRDAMNVEVGAIVREYVQGAYRPIDTPFVGEAALGVLQYYERVKTSRVGRALEQPGVDPDVLQSTAADAANAAVSASEEQVILMAQMLAEGWKTLYQKILRLVVKHQFGEAMVRLRGRMVPVDPRPWNAEMDVQINVGLGTSLPRERAAVLAQFAQKQEQILETMGPDNPLVSLHQYSNTLRKLLELAGIEDTARHISKVPADWKPPPPPDPGPDPNLLVAQAEQMKAQAAMYKAQVDAQLEAQKLQWEDDRERDKMEINAVVKALEIEAKHNTQIDVARIRAAAQSVNRSRKESRGDN